MSIRQQKSYTIDDSLTIVQKTLNWAQQFSHFTYFNPNSIPYPFDPFKHLLAVGCHKQLQFDSVDDFQSLKKQYQTHKDWLIGYFGYDLKNQLEALESSNHDRNEYDPICFYIPEHIIRFEKNKLIIESLGNTDDVFDQINNNTAKSAKPLNRVDIIANISKNEYLSAVKKIQEHIIEGDVYELNYCMEFYADQVNANPLSLYQKLSSYSPTPFSVFQKLENKYLICASPERFIKKEGQKFISQPIKGTIKRGSTSEEDVTLQYQLKHSDKERAENMMIVDLVRNDLSKSCNTGSVRVEEMFGVYPFKHLHQMISTISGELKGNVHFIDAIKHVFPMGSMTGAPKVMAMKLIEQYEVSKRGLFSGAVGYITPNGDFDFNVVIRSIFYDSQKNTASFQVGSAITYDSDPEQEYEECMLKANAIRHILTQDAK